jgi:protein-disulfide isomerase
MNLDRRTLALVAIPVAAAAGLGFWFLRPGEAPRTAAPAAPAAPGQPATPAPAPPAVVADANATPLSERSIGRADAPVTVIEYFSLTCGHCAGFHRDTMPRVKRELVDTGRIRMVLRDFPLDAVALAAAQVARSLPVERYEPFVATLFAQQDRWAFARNSDPREEMFKIAALAGMSRAQYDAALADQDLARGILELRVKGQQEHIVASTPTFVFGTRTVPGNMAFDRFAALVAETR